MKMDLRNSSALHPAGAVLERKDDNGGTGASQPVIAGEVKKLLEELQRSNHQFQKKITQQIDEERKNRPDPITAEEAKRLNDRLDEIGDQVKAARLEQARPELILPNGSKRTVTAAEQKHRSAVIDYMRKGDVSGFEDAEVKALSVGSDPDGGYLVDSVLDAEISRVVSEISPMRQLASITTLGTAPQYRKLVNVSGSVAGWTGEQGSRTETDTSTLRERRVNPGELYALPYITQNMLDDASVNIEAWLTEEVRIIFAEYESDAFINGNGVDKPRGIVGGYTPIANASFTEASDRPGYVATTADGAFKTTADGDQENNILDLVYALKKAYRRNASFLMARPTMSEVRKIRDADGRSLWQPMTMSGEPDTLLGFPVEEDDEMPVIASNSYSIAFGDFRAAYRIVDKGGTRVLRDPYSAKPYVQFYTTRRVGGAVQMFEAYKLLKFGTS